MGFTGRVVHSWMSCLVKLKYVEAQSSEKNTKQKKINIDRRRLKGEK